MKTLAKSLLLLTIAITTYSIVNCQTTLPGGIITNNGDTINGTIKWQQKIKNPNVISFQAADNSAFRDYQPVDISGFYVQEAFYESGKVQIDKNPEGTVYATRKDFQFSNEPVFLSRIVSGPKPLFHLIDKDGFEHFYIRNDKNYELLLYKSYTAYDDQNVLIRRYVKTYIDQLKAYLSDNSSVHSSIAKTDFRYNQLVNLFSKYYSGKNADANIVNVKKQHSHVEIGAVAGVSYSGLKIVDNEIGDYDKSTNFAGGVSFDIYLPGKLNRASINSDFLYTSYKATVVTKSNSTNYYVAREMVIGASYIKMYTMGRYRFPVQKNNVFFNAGISNGFAVQVKNKAVEKTILNGNVQSQKEAVAINDFRKYEQGYFLGAGLRIRKIGIETRFEKGNGMSSYGNLKTTSTRYFLLGSYAF